MLILFHMHWLQLGLGNQHLCFVGSLSYSVWVDIHESIFYVDCIIIHRWDTVHTSFHGRVWTVLPEDG